MEVEEIGGNVRANRNTLRLRSKYVVLPKAMQSIVVAGK